MKLALIGSGRMGSLVAEHARRGGHDVVEVVDGRAEELSARELAARLAAADAVVDFSVASAVVRNVEASALAGKPIVEGTTGWLRTEPRAIASGSDAVDRAFEAVREAGTAIVHGANFSLGANLFYRVVARAADVFARAADFDAFVEEAHHAGKRDAPSGTALRLRDLLEPRLARPVPIASTRAGHIPGTHRVGFDSPAEQIALVHEARSRDGFAAGALLAARWATSRTGVFTFTDVVDSLFEGDNQI